MVGASLTATTVSVNERFVVSVPSLTPIVIVAWPDLFGSGVISTVRFAPLPPKTTFEFWISAGSDDDADRLSDAGGDSTSPIVKAIGPVGVSSLVLWLEIAETVGASFTALTVTWKVVWAWPPAPSLTVTVTEVTPDALA